MIGWHAQRSLGLWTVLATLGLPACAGKALISQDCRSDASCGGMGGSAGGKGEAGSAAVAGTASGGEAGGTTLGACENGVKDESESDVDCGGPSSCARCFASARCSANRDCESNFCKNAHCAEATCADKLKNQNETNVDCGGVCPPCLEPATCSDGIKNQNESDLDCGGVCSAQKRCAVDQRCTTAGDCESWVCSAGKCLADIVIPPAAVIDDFEDGDFSLPTNPAREGRAGNWYTANDGSGIATLDVLAIKRGASSVNGLHARGKDFKIWGSGFAVDLNNPGGNESGKATFDASAYSGITFWARAETPTMLIVALPNADTDEAGKICSVCSHHYGRQQQLTTTWQRFTVPFAELSLEVGGVPAPKAFDSSGLVSVFFRFAQGASYDVQIDDVAFIKN